MDHKEQPGVEDVLPVRSRISWGAVFAGGLIALAMFLVLTVLGAAAGLSLSETNIRSSTLGWAAVVWSIFSLLVALFVGGFVTTQCAVGENKTEGIIHGVLMWSAVFGTLACLTGMGIRAGYTTLLGASYLTRGTEFDPSMSDWERMARRLGMSEEQIARARERGDEIRNQAADPETQQQVVHESMKTSWWTLAGMILSIAAAAGGAYLGSGPTFQFIGWGRRSSVVINRSNLVAQR